MITNPTVYLFTLAFIATFFFLLESKTSFKIFKLIPSVVFIYGASMLVASLGLFDTNAEINAICKQTKSNLLPSMLFLMLLQVDLRYLLKIGKSLLIAYILAVFSIGVSFVLVMFAFGFSPEMSRAFDALAGSWIGGTANMIAVGEALHVGKDALDDALVVDSVNYTLWVTILLFLVPFASYFNKFTKSRENIAYLEGVGCACTIGTKRYWLLIFLSLSVSFLTQYLSTLFTFHSTITTVVILATLFGTLGSFTKLRELSGSSEVANSMLFMIIALIGSHSVIKNFSGLGVYVFAGFCILLLHAAFMTLGAKIFRLDLFSVGVASLVNIGGVASAPILAAAYNKSLVSVAVLMAIMGYIIGTFGGLLIGSILTH